MKVLVTGGSGFLGSHIVEQLSAAGREVVALVRKSSKVDFLTKLPNVELAYGAVEDADSVRAAMKGVDAVIHSAGLVKARTEAEFLKINADGTSNLLAAAKEIAPGLKRFVLVSSLAAVGPSLDGSPVPGDSEPRPLTHYGRSKLEAERRALAEKDNLPVVILRPPMIYGPRDNESFAFFQSVSRRFLPYLGDGQNTMSVIYATDAASACVRAIDANVPSGSRYFIEDGEIYVWRDMLGEIEKALGSEALIRFSIPLWAMRAAATASELMGKATGKAVMLTRDKVNELSAPHWVCDASDTRRDLGWEPKVKWREGAARAAQWYRENGWL
jgi:nucleoside-diphosphate-sugar epimerase